MPGPVHVLLVEDSEDDALLVDHLLRRHADPVAVFRVDTAEGLRAALARQAWDIVVSDYQMPCFGGLAALKQVREFDADLPFILVSATIGEEVAVEAMRAGANDYVMKNKLARLLPALQRELRTAADRRNHAIRDRAQRERLDYLACYDPLTGLANRTLFVQRLGQRAAGDSRPEPFAVFVAELHRLEAIGDALGRNVADTLLRQAGDRIRSRTSDECRVARVGAERLALLVPRPAGGGDVLRRLGDEICGCFVEPFEIDGSEFKLDAAVGIARCPDDGCDAELLLRKAEAAATRAKESGEPHLFYVEQMTAALTARLALERKLRRALENDELTLHYQPKVDRAAGRVVAVEALMRWRDPQSGLVLPGHFIRVLEETGMILEAGSWALRRAVLDRHTWPLAGAAAPRVAVNVSVIQLRRRDFVATVDQAISHAPGPCGLDLEITESVLMDDVKGCIAKLSAIRDLGVRISIDDFGTGFSSLSYLAKLPVHAVKIDRSFIHGMLDDADAMTLVTAMIGLAHSLRLTVIAEGVESAEQASALRGLGCDEMQGYLFGRPVPCESMAAILRSPQPIHAFAAQPA
jgi:diguanylate cyclase (GGDEF)-like protein